MTTPSPAATFSLFDLPALVAFIVQRDADIPATEAAITAAGQDAHAALGRTDIVDIQAAFDRQAALKAQLATFTAERAAAYAELERRQAPVIEKWRQESQAAADRGRDRQRALRARVDQLLTEFDATVGQLAALPEAQQRIVNDIFDNWSTVNRQTTPFGLPNPDVETRLDPIDGAALADRVSRLAAHLAQLT